MISQMLCRGHAMRPTTVRHASHVRRARSSICCRTLTISSSNDEGRYAVRVVATSSSMPMAFRPTAQARATRRIAPALYNSFGIPMCLSSRNSLRSFTTSTASRSPADECYAKALQALEMARSLEVQKEDQRAAEQYESMIKAREREEERARARTAKKSAAATGARQRLAELDDQQTNTDGGGGMHSRAAGVAVIKTITKQTRKERKKETANNADIGSNLAARTTAGDEIGQYKDEAQRWLRTAAFEHAHPKALVRLGNEALEEAKLSLHASSGAQNYAKDDSDIPTDLMDLTPLGRACRLYHMAGEAGSAEGWFNLGHLLWMGFPEQEGMEEEGPLGAYDDISSNVGVESLPNGKDNTIDVDRATATSCFQRAVDMGDPDAMYFLGVNLISMGDANSDQRRRGLDLIDRAATIGHAGALYYLALFHLNGDAGLDIKPCSPAQFVERLNLAADAGDSDALFLRGHCHYNGEDGYARNYQIALEDFISAASAGNADAAISAGSMLYHGQVVPQDRRRAFELYQEAAELGSKDGWRNLVSCYMLGHGVPKSEETAKHIADTMLRGD